MPIVPQGCGAGRVQAHRATTRCHATAVPDPAAARLDGARVTQLRATELLAKLLEASDPTGEARQHVESLTEDFFMTSSTYLTLARKEGNADVASRLERALSAAWAVKQATMRPELQLLNGLVRAESDAARRQMYVSGGSDLVDTLRMNDRWFFSMLERMTNDVERQPPNPGKAQLLTRLRSIKKEAEALEKQAARQQAQQDKGQKGGAK
ncbi:hypothetical protein CHLRE_17g742550v5 [Chlamydomonas reinhardtii]|uniref:Uncharacterized protein n=1 Tax=Chlamydomonas reinhardtii TaxID=3055 RepID=A8JEB4_CHLRE|nr:uncharacterized protein CHLRE_17g742550v5 [Chlamydomonas reinhardtii]PNW71008.1 hypothetical protein CHLRE_17g742550v5 [Chlamydomonas reinhardtii]|eukprot:XP_001701129.1 predicted protein [Chlamydomonas reinhardtii]